MDVERTIDFILKTQAKTEVRLGGITKLIQQGMRMLVKNEAAIAQLTEAQKGTDAKLARLADAQKRTDAKLRVRTGKGAKERDLPFGGNQQARDALMLLGWKQWSRDKDRRILQGQHAGAVEVRRGLVGE